MSYTNRCADMELKEREILIESARLNINKHYKPTDMLNPAIIEKEGLDRKTQICLGILCVSSLVAATIVTVYLGFWISDETKK